MGGLPGSHRHYSAIWNQSFRLYSFTNASRGSLASGVRSLGHLSLKTKDPRPRVGPRGPPKNSYYVLFGHTVRKGFQRPPQNLY